MKISVIIPFYKEIELIGRATESVVINATNVCEYEILVCNDGGFSENEIRSKISDDANCCARVLRNSCGKGPGGARNTGLDAATGELIAFLDADDYWLPGKIKLQLNAVLDNATFVATGYSLGLYKNNVMPPKRIKNASDILMLRGIGTSTVLANQELIGNLRFRDIRFAQDIDFWYALAKRSVFKYVPVKEVCVVYSTSGSTKNKFVQLKYYYRILCLNGLSFDFRVRAMSRYIYTGVYNHYIKKHF